MRISGDVYLCWTNGAGLFLVNDRADATDGAWNLRRDNPSRDGDPSFLSETLVHINDKGGFIKQIRVTLVDAEFRSARTKYLKPTVVLPTDAEPTFVIAGERAPKKPLGKRDDATESEDQ